MDTRQDIALITMTGGTILFLILLPPPSISELRYYGALFACIVVLVWMLWGYFLKKRSK